MNEYKNAKAFIFVVTNITLRVIMATNNIRMGELEMRALFKLEEAKASLVTTRALAEMLEISLNRVNKLAWQLSRKKRLLRVRKGAYLFAPLVAGPNGHWSEDSRVLLSQLLENEEYYYSFATASNYYSLTEQIPWTTQAVVTKRRRDFEAVATKYQFTTVSKLGEWREEKIAGKIIRIATKEQLVIDCLQFPWLCGGLTEAAKVVWNARKEIDWKKLGEMANASKSAVGQRLGFLQEALGLKPVKLRGKHLGWRMLDPKGSKTIIEKNSKWMMLVNFDKRDLVNWMES